VAESWPTFQNLTTPFKKAGQAVPGASGPPISPEVIQQIADSMDKLPPTPVGIGDKCQQLLSGMPEQNLDHLQPGQQIKVDAPPSELEKLLKTGYRPLENIDGKWTETSTRSGKLILENQK